MLKENLKAAIAGINECLLTTLGACGDVARNVMACPAPVYDGKRDQLQRAANELAIHLRPRSLAYHEIWLDGQPIEDGQPAIEPLYGKTYLPRKFKIGFALPDDNCVDVYAQDLGFLAVVEAGSVVGYNALVGGGMGMTHGNANTFPHLARPVCFVAADQVTALAEAVISLFRDHGNRSDKRRASYLVHWESNVSRVLVTPEQPPCPGQSRSQCDASGWHDQGAAGFIASASRMAASG